ncbi:ras-related protein Rab-2-A-like [Nicotiana tomentosiformis]|uniref:ras-related protein Rab-2-A-like n=1 Tax=Nicotiana tomentosiformis TaxID=4098 RepID=UPI00051B6E4D|nr:ras-related protein Rab-2-A-like [Nicotiana tomentosiformis]
MAYEYLMKFIVVGETGVGKTCIMNQFTEKRFDPVYDVTIGAGYGSRIITVHKKQIKLQIWDTAGQEKFRSITRAYYRDAAGALLVYDVTKRHTFERLSSWLEDIRQQGDTTVMVVGNKCDAGENIRAVSAEEGEEFAKSNGCLFVEASAKTALNVAAAFNNTAEKICEKMGYGDVEKVDETPGINIWNWKRFRIGRTSSDNIDGAAASKRF